MNKKALISLVTCIFLLLSACGDDAAVMPAEICQVTCIDDATGDTYGIAFRAIAWNNEDDGIADDVVSEDGEDYGCFLYVDAYQGKIGESGDFEDEDGQAKFWTSGIVGPLEEYGNAGVMEGEDLMYTLSFLGNNFDGSEISEGDFETTYVPLESLLIYQLLDESTIQITQTTSSIAAQYIHSINPCILDAQLTLEAHCSRTGKGYANIDCTAYTPDTAIYDVRCDACGEDEEIKCPTEAASCTDDINSEDIDDSVQSLMDEVEEATS